MLLALQLLMDGIATIGLNAVCLADAVIHIGCECILYCTNTTILYSCVSPRVVCPMRVDGYTHNFYTEFLSFAYRLSIAMSSTM